MPEYTRDQIYVAIRNADRSGDADAVRALAAQLKAMEGVDPVQEAIDSGATRDEVISIARQNNLELNEADLDANLASRDQGGQTSPVQQPTSGVGAQLQRYGGDIVTTMGKGAAKALAGPFDLAMEAGGALQSGITSALTGGSAAALDIMGLEGAAQNMRAAGDLRQNQISQGTQQFQFRNALDNVLPTPQGFEMSETGTELVAGMAIPFKMARAPVTAPQRANSNALEVVAEGARRNVPVKTTDVLPPKSAMGRYIKQTLPEKIPIAGTSGGRQVQQEARQQAVVDLVEEFGGDAGRALFDDSDTIAQQVSKTLTQQRSQRLTNLKQAKDSVIDGVEGTAPVPRALKALDDEIAAMVERDTPASREVAEILKAQRAELSKPRTLRGIEDFRADEISKAFDNPDTLAAVKTVGEKSLRKIYDPLRQDMADFIETQAGGSATAKWSRANKELSAMMGEMESTAFKNVLKQSDTTPETISRILFSGSENTSDMARLVSNLDDAGKRKVQGALMTRAFEKAGGADGVSVERFLNNLKQLSGKIGVAFQGEDRAALEGVRKLLEATRRGAEAGANVRTGEQNLPAIMGIGATQAFGFAGGVSTLGIGGLLARVYESPAVRNYLIGLSKTQPGSAAEGKILTRIMRASAPIVNNWKDDVARAANDIGSRSPGAVAAQDEQDAGQIPPQ